MPPGENYFEYICKKRISNQDWFGTNIDLSWDTEISIAYINLGINGIKVIKAYPH